MDDERFWPFPIVKPEAEWSRFDRDYVEFMRAAHGEGYRPRAPLLEFRRRGRSVRPLNRHDLPRKRERLEVCPRDGALEVKLGPAYALQDYACVCVRPPFSAAGHFALEWLRGRELNLLLAEFDFVGRSPPGIVLRPVAADCPAGPGDPGVA